MIRRFTALTMLGLLALPSASGAQQLYEEELVWPLPPEAPRIRYLGYVSSEADIGKSEGFLSKLRNRLSGTRSSVLGVQRPHDVHVDGGTRYFVTDGGKGKVVLFNLDTQTATVVGNEGLGILRKPLGVGGDGQGMVYVADGSGARVVAFDRDGNYARAYGGEDVLLNPADVTADAERDRLYVVDSYQHQVVVFSISTGEVVNRIGKNEDDLAAKREILRNILQPGTHGEMGTLSGDTATEATHAGTPPRDLTLNRGGGPGEMRYPAFIAVAPDGTIYVSDQMNFRVQAFAPDGTFLRQIGQIGRTPGSFSRPKGLGVDNEGHLYVTDALFNNVQVFDDTGQLLLVFGSVGTDAGEMYLPLGMQVDRENRIYVADRFNDRVQVFEFLGSPAVVTDAANR